MIKVITQTKLGLQKTYELNPKDVRLINRGGVGVNLHNLLNIPKSEIIIKVE